MSAVHFVQVRLFDCLVENVLGRVHSGEVDFGIGPEREPSADIEARTLFELPFVVVFPKGHPLEKKKRVSWDDALRYPVIALQGEFTQRLRVDLHASLSDQALQPSHEVSFMTTALAMVSAGLGVTTCLPYADALITRYQLLSRPLLDPVVQRKFFVFTRRDRPYSPAAQRFASYLFEHMASYHQARWAD
ncbi:LysR substrate-binding domain-containing protein [Rhodoferax sp.]|uniref:LysR substrate-binding domain-containing protein n=1 Tax=Rhodoferax sp. TaxID=50421 RepID=UPI0027485179|nr:LysR substrate-binding domain-containing protein [Rhodoferax sp.]